MNQTSERGSAIIMLFVAVALFGLLAFAFMQGSRSNVSWLGTEQQKAADYSSQDCTNAINMATKRLTARGCTAAEISADETGAVGAGPADGSCAIYHVNGGSVKPCS